MCKSEVNIIGMFLNLGFADNMTAIEYERLKPWKLFTSLVVISLAFRGENERKIIEITGFFNPPKYNDTVDILKAHHLE